MAPKVLMSGVVYISKSVSFEHGVFMLAFHEPVRSDADAKGNLAAVDGVWVFVENGCWGLALGALEAG